LNPSEIAGAYVRCYIPAFDADLAMGSLYRELLEMKMALVR